MPVFETLQCPLQHCELAVQMPPVTLQHLHSAGLKVTVGGLQLEFTHPPPHSVVPSGQVHAPATQMAPGAHLVPQVPQLLTSVCVFTQVPLQETVPLGHSHRQVVELNCCPPLHVLATHCPPHSDVPVGQAWQVCVVWSQTVRLSSGQQSALVIQCWPTLLHRGAATALLSPIQPSSPADEPPKTSLRIVRRVPPAASFFVNSSKF